MESLSKYFSFSVSENHIYCIISSEKINTTMILIHLLNNLFEHRKEINREGENTSLFVIDDASIQKL